MKQSLNYNWQFIKGYTDTYLNEVPDDIIDVDIPHSAEIIPYNYFSIKKYLGEYTYFKNFDISDYKNYQVFTLRFEAFMLQAKIYLNGKFLGDFISGYIPVEIDISEFVKEKDNHLIVILSTKEDPLIPPFGNKVDYLTFGGIYRGVYLLKNKKNYIKKSLIHASKNGEIDINDILSTTSSKYKILHEIYLDDELITANEKNHFKIDNPQLWDIDNPTLYTLKTIIRSEDGEECYFTKFGFRDATFKKDGFYLNDKKIKLLGLNRHQSYPYIGYAASKSLQIDDANTLKYEAGVNVVRTSHYPQDENFLNRCDEIGLLVINEIPGWQFISQEEKWRNQHFDNVKSMIIEEYNHPSLIAHGIRIDESIDDHNLYLESNKIAHSLDKYRPTLGVRNFKDSELLEDIYAYNDFSSNSLNHGLDNPKTIKSLKKDTPYLVSEYLGHMLPTKAFDNEERRIEHALRHATIINDINKYSSLTGGIAWCAFDYNTHQEFGSGDNVCYHGIFDIFRNRKYASYIYQSQSDFTPVLKVLSSFNLGDFSSSNYHCIYIATNLDYVDLYSGDKFIKRYLPLNSEFPNMTHPLIKVDDIIGDSFTDERFKDNDKIIISKLLSKLAFNSINDLSLKDKLKMKKMIKKYHRNNNDLDSIFDRYINLSKDSTFVFKGYKNNKIARVDKFGHSSKTFLDVSSSKNELVNEDTYDTLRITVRHVDEYDHVLNYSFLPLFITVDGPIKLLSPNSVSLVGGQISIYARSIREKGDARIIISTPIDEKIVDIKVK